MDTSTPTPASTPTAAPDAPPVSTVPTAPSPGAPPAVAATEDKTVAIVGYLTLIGFIVAIVLNSNKKTQLGAFHLRQMLGLILTSLLGIIPFLGIVVILFLFVLWIMGILSATKGEMKPAPLLGPLYQKWFGTAFN
jgi:hypothetical protein